VDPDSAERVTNQFRGGSPDHIASNTDHRGLVRFDHRHDTRYRSMMGQISSIVNTVLPSVSETLRHAQGTQVFLWDPHGPGPALVVVQGIRVTPDQQTEYQLASLDGVMIGEGIWFKEEYVLPFEN